MKQLDYEKVKVQYVAFAETLKTLMLSTVDEDGNPFISYAPFVKKNGKLYVYLSQIANHYQHIERNPAVDVMMIEDESLTVNLFARQRARFICTAVNVGNEGYDDVFDSMRERFGKGIIDMLRGLDFSLFELTAREGRYVAGFGQAYDIDLSGDRFDHVNRDGHTPRT